MVHGILVERSQRMQRWPSSSSCMEVIGLCRIGVSKAHLSNTQGAHMLWFVGKDVFSDVVHFVLLNSPRAGCGTEEAPLVGCDMGKCRLRELSRCERGDEQLEEF